MFILLVESDRGCFVKFQRRPWVLAVATPIVSPSNYLKRWNDVVQVAPVVVVAVSASYCY